MARALDELTQPPESKPTEFADPLGDSFFHQPAQNEQPATLTRPTTRQAYVERIKAEDLQARGIPTFRNASGGVSPITDETGTALTGFDTRHNIAYDSKGQPKQISYDETGPPKLSDPFAALPTRLDPKTGALEKYGPGGIYQYQGQDPVVTADLARKEKDKSIQHESALLNRKLTLDEHDLHAGIADQKVLKAELKTAVPTLIDPKYEGADRNTVMKAIDEHFNSQYAAPEANDTRGWFGKELSPEATLRRKEIDAAKAKAYESASSLFDLNDQLSTLHETVAASRASERASVETLLAHTQGAEGPLDVPATAATPEGGTKKPQLFPPESEWARMLGGKDAVAQMHDQIQTGNVPPQAAPAVLAATHDYQDAKKKADAVKESDPTLYEQYSNIAANILNGLTKGVGQITKGSYAEPGWSTVIDPLQQSGLITSWVGSLVTGETPKQYRERTRAQVSDAEKVPEQFLDERLKDSIGSKVGNFVGGMAPYVAAAMATKGKSVATPLMASLFYTSGYQSTYEDAKAHGASDTKADLAGIGVGAINAVLALPLRTVGKAAEAIFGDTAPKVIQRAITNAFEHGGPEAAGTLLGRLAEQIKAGGAGSEALRKEAVEGINSIMAEIAKPASQRVLDVAKTAATHAALGAGVQTSENLLKKTYNPDQGTFEGVAEQAIGFGALGGLSEGFKQVADARKAKQALDIINKKAGGAPPAEPPALGPRETPPGGPTPTAPAAPKVRETSPKAAPTEKPAVAREVVPTKKKAAEAVTDIASAEKAYVERGGHADKLDAQNKLAELQKAFPDPAARMAAIQERLAPLPPGVRVAFADHGELGPVDAEAHKAATSPQNALPEPSQAQKEAGNYQKGHVQVAGLDISIENPAGSKRKPEYRALESHYGYIKGTVGADKDHVDIFVKKETPADWSGPVFVVNQVNAKGKFDEHKAVIGVKNQSDALKEYNANYQPGWKGAHSVVKFDNAADFKAWAESGATGEPASQTAVRIRPPEGSTMSKPQIEGAHVVSTAVKSGEKYLVGTKWNTAHEGIGTFHGLDEVKQSDRGFIVQDEKGDQKFVTRKEAGPIAQAAGQASGPIGEKGIQSADLQPAVSRAERKVTNLVKGTLAKHRSTLASIGHDVAPRIGKTDSDSGIQAKLNRQSVPMITLDPKKLAEATKGMDDRAQSKYVQRAVEEEILHVGALRWELQAPENNVAIKEWGAERDELDTHLAGSYPGWEDLSERQKGHEKLRAVLQKRWTGKLTEAATRVLKAFLKYLRGIYEKLTPGQQEIVQGVESILRGETAPAGRVEPEPAKTSPGETTAPKLSKLQARGRELNERLLKVPDFPATEGTVIRTLLKSGTKVALDQAEKKIGKLEEKHASKEPSTKTVGVRSEGGGLGEGAPLRQPGKTPGPSKPVGSTGSSSLDAQTQKELSEAFEGLFASLPKNLTDKGAGIQQRAIPAEKIGPFVTVAGKLVAQGVDTPQKLAAELETLFQGKARPFSQALWDAIGMVRPELRGTHDWTAIYGPGDQEKPGTAAPATVLPQNRDQLIRQVSLSLQTGPVTRRQLTEMAKESGLDVKRVDEAAETAIVMAARDMAEPLTTDISPLTIFDQMVELYDRQPNLTAKTSTSKVNQAYSTPVPLAYAASRLAGINDNTSVLEPTAGNGALLIEANPDKTTANEMDETRRAALTAMGFRVKGQDATEPGLRHQGYPVDVVIANPPFGTILDEHQLKKTWPLWDNTTDQIDHAIAANALESMKDDGRAVLILGGKNMKDPDERAKAYIGSENQRNFWPKLYQRYNVVDHFTIDGDLYSKQGAGWPVDVVVIAGRGGSRIQLPSAEAPRILTSWGELRNELSRSDDERIEAGRYNPERDSAKVGGLVDSIRGVAQSESGIGPKKHPERAPATDGGGGRPESVAPTVRSEPEPPARREPQPSDVAPARGAGELGTGTTDVQSLERGQQLAFRAPYKPASKLPSFGIFIPTNMEAPAREALTRLQERIGPIDEFVRKKLGYPEGAPLGKYFSAEQMDALALGIDAIDGETAFVLGDQGGVGKGRVAAGMIAYAKQQGKVPIFITKDEKLYAAMIEDLHDIGQDHVVPVFTNNGIEFEDYSGTKWKQGSMTAVMKELARTGKLPMHADVLFTTYSQIQTDVPAGYKASKAERASLKSSHKAPPDGVRMEALKKLAPGSIIIADESHLAAGDSIRAWRLSPLLAESHGVYYSSATFAKRPDSMGIYSRTSLSHATTSMGDLVDAMKQGGVPLQQVVSAILASDGLYLRRERDFSKAVFRTQINVETRERDAMLADNYTEGLRAILNISNKMKDATDFLNKILRREAKQMHVENAPRVESTNFSSKLHNLVSQYLFAIKAEAMVRRAIEGVTVGFPNKAGDVLKHKVIIAVQNTMEQPILALERSAHPLNFKGMLLQYLDTQRTLVSGRGQSAQVTRISDKPDPKFEKYSDKDLQRLIIVPNPKNPEETGVNEPALNELFRRIMAGKFKDAETLIESLDLADMPLSPIDHIRQKLSQTGIKNAEITKRGTGIDEDGQIYKLDPSSNTKAAHLRYMSDFNNGDTDVMVINASGSTGISLHSSKKFKRTDPRAMIIGQPHLDINEFMQTLYRTDRTGQVHQPYYELLQTAIPAELRPAAILNRKMGSLNANTTSNAENEISAGNVGVDIFNQYGDEVVYNYLKSDRVFTDMLDMPKIMTDTGLGQIDDVLGLYEEDGQFAAAVTGRVAVLPTAEQEEFWNKVSADYVAKINYLNELGENELQAEAIDMKAETIDRKELTPAVVGKGRASGFDQPSYLERIKADIGMKPLPGPEVVTMMEELGSRAYELRNDWMTRAEAWKKTELERLATKVLSWDSEKRAHYEARWREQEEEINAAIGLIGDGLHLKTEKGLDGYGAITDVKFDEDHPLTPSKQIFTVHVNTTKKVLRVAASQLPSIARQAVGDFADLYEATAERSNERYMITGNLLSAYLAIRDAAPSAKIVQYTTDQGELRQGILMPQKFAPGALSKKRVVDGASHMRTLLDAGRALANADNAVTIVKPSGPDYVMRVPSSRTMGGAYWRDSQLAGLMAGGEFVERSGGMVGKFDAATLPKVYQRLLDLNASLFYTETDEALGAGKPHKAPAAFYKDDVEPIARSIGMSVKESFDMLKHLVSPTSGVTMDAHDRVMKMLGERNQKAYETDRVLDAWGKALDKMPRPQLIDFVDRMKLGKPQATPELQELAQTMRKIDTESWDAAVAAYSALGFKDKEIPLQWLENHYRVLWKKIPGDTAEEKGAWIGKTRRGLRGSMGQHKQHTLETMSDGLAMGGVPYSYNPVEMFKLAQADLWKLTTTLQVWKWGKDNHFVEYVKGPFPKAPDGMVPLDDPIARVYFPSESGEGLVNAGQYFVEEGFGRLLNNYLSRDFIRQTRLGRGLLWLKNATTSLELSLSPFHAVFETLEMVGSDIGLGLQKLVNRGLMKGDLGAAASGIKDILGAPAAPFTGWHLGREIRKAAGDPEAYFKTAAGKKMLKSYPRAREFIDDLFSAGWKPNELEQDWKNESVRAFVESVADLKAGKSDNYVGAGLRAFPAANEMLMKPLFDWYIPSLKVAQFFKEYAEAIEQNERKLKGGILTRAALARQVWRFVEDRFGEMNFDSLFWNRNFKTAMQLMFRSVTWKLGSVHAFGGAFAGQGKEFKDAFRERRAPELHRNMAWLFGMFLLTATLGAIISKALGKKDPKNLTDFVFPQIDPKDDKLRVSLPTYFKDMVHLIHDPKGYVTSSMSGWIGRVADLLRNKDYYGVQIRDSDESIVKQALQVAGYTGQSLLPFSVRGYKQMSDQDVNGLRKALSFVAINPAPRHVSQTLAEKRSEEYWKGHQTAEGISPEQFESKREKRRIVGQLRHGDAPDFGAALATGAIKPADIKPLYQRAQMGPLASQVFHMPLADAEKVYQRANLKERAELAGVMEKKRANSAKRGRKMFTGF